jgi:cytochrome c
MKKIVYLLSITTCIAVVIACGPKTEKKNAEEFNANETATEKPAASDPIAEGESLVKAGDCKTCHHKTNKIIGPAHLDVAKKYEFTKANVELLAAKIIKGGSGTWGDIPMAAHPDVTQGDAEKMAKYVLSLDGEKEH